MSRDTGQSGTGARGIHRSPIRGEELRSAHEERTLSAASAAAPAPGLVLVQPKLHVPRVRAGFVPRDELVERLAGGADRRLTLVCAPAGWGKSVLLAQWHAVERRPFAWVSLDRTDDDPIRFWSDVIAALRTVAPGFGGATLAMLPNAGPGVTEIVLPRLINELAELPEPVVLVLDDYHLISDEIVHASVAFLLAHLPPTLQLVLASRADPPTSGSRCARRNCASTTTRPRRC